MLHPQAESSESSPSDHFPNRWVLQDDGWIRIHTRRVSPSDLNAYGTLFGGVLLGEAVVSAEHFLDIEAPGMQVWRLSDFLFERAALPGETLVFLLKAGEVQDALLRLHIRIQTQPDAEAANFDAESPRTIGTCLLWVGSVESAAGHTAPEDDSVPPLPTHESTDASSPKKPSDWHFTQSRWVIRGDCHLDGRFQTRSLLALLDETAVSFCRDQGKVGRFVTRRVSRFHLRAPLHLDDTLKIYFRVQDSGRSSLTVQSLIVRTFSHARGCVSEVVGDATFIMVATDAHGKPIRHALSLLPEESIHTLVDRPSIAGNRNRPSLAHLATVRLSSFSDQQELRRFFAGISERSLRQRYLGTFQHDWQHIEQLATGACNLQPHREQTVVITLPDPQSGVPTIVGLGQLHLAVLEPEAEISLLVADSHQGRGLGARLVAELINRCSAQSYERLEATFFRENMPMRRLLERNGFRIKGTPGESVLSGLLDIYTDS